MQKTQSDIEFELLLKQYKEGKSLSEAQKEIIATGQLTRRLDKSAQVTQMLNDAREHAVHVMNQSKQSQHDESRLSKAEKLAVK